MGVKSQDELLSSLLTLLKSGVDAHMHAASVALWHCHPGHLPVLQPVRCPHTRPRVRVFVFLQRFGECEPTCRKLTLIPPKRL